MSEQAASMIEQIGSMQDLNLYRELTWEGSFDEYLEVVRERPEVTRNAYQRMYDMIIRYGTEEYTDSKKKLVRYNFFQDEFEGGKDAIYGLDIPLMRLVNVLKAASQGYGPEKRIILLHGPVGSSKSTIVRLIKKGLQHYTRTPDGALYTYDWINLDSIGMSGTESDSFASPMHEEPLRLIPAAWRAKAIAKLELGNDRFQVNVEGDLNPACRYIYARLMDHYSGDWTKVIEHVRVRRLVFSEQDRVGIGTFQPKDEKNQDSTELTGDINYRKIAIYGSDSDPRAFNFDGEFNIANRGVLEFIEVLKLDVAFLYDLLGATQEHKVKPKKFAQTDIDEVIIGHTNEAEYQKLLNNEYMEALRDRTIKIDIPYITKVSEEVRIYEKDFRADRVRGKHVAPHTLEVAAMWAVLTRMEDPKKHNLELVQKMKLYDGKVLPGYTQDTVKELRKETNREGLEGISPRYVQDKISNALVNEAGQGTINPFMVLNELEKGLRHHSLITSEEQRKRFEECIGMVKAEYEDIVKNEVQRAISADEDAIQKLAANYIDSVKAYTLKEKVKDRFTGKDVEPDERLMRSVEEKIEIPEERKDDFRREIMNYIGALAVEGKKFEWHTNDRLRRALELKLFEDQKDTIKLQTLVTNVIDKETQDKIDIIKSRMIKYFGYNEVSARDVLDYVASIYARGDVK
ncbi:MAG: serine protein kinase [Deltaproteobacteria bacterium]|jgi:serine protein kinase|nr:serine protein kinase [Deltaproteobacteria bacterium]MBW2537957.1 serine protein kinase [Deltaproteobacteria bacterium]